MHEEKFIFMGSDEFIMTYKALGLEGVIVNDGESLDEAINNYSLQNYDLFFIEEALGSKIYPRLNYYEDRGKNIILISGATSNNFTLVKLKQMVERLIGVDLFKEED